MSGCDGLFNPAGQRLDAGEDGCEHHQSVSDDGKPVAPWTGHVGPADDDGSDAEGLKEHFKLAGPDGAELDATGFGDMPQCLDDDLAGKDNHGCCPADDVHGRF